MSDQTHGQVGPDDDSELWRWPTLSPVTADSSAASGDDGAEWLDWVDAAEDTPAAAAGVDDDAADAGFALDVDVLPEDPMAPVVATMRKRAQAQARRRAALVRLGVGGGVLVAVAAVVVGVVFVMGGNGKDAAAAGPAPVAATPVAATTSAKPVWCKEIDTPTRVVSSGPGDETTAIGVIVAQQYAWYVMRDANAVRAHLAPDAAAAAPEATANAIASTPAGTAHCVTVTAEGENRFTVNVVERHPDGTEVPWDQVVTTTVRDGRVLITSIK
ncbi:hypothetical protein [Nocardia yamanashiensis]|uniref:hypothetical protein n=1 Tax=Nocardia yamanashiensis TaxID=209247 RepID=UPI000A4B06D8|nr:hypothetical protein [Nocardia yamanashiensis]